MFKLTEEILEMFKKNYEYIFQHCECHKCILEFLKTYDTFLINSDEEDRQIHYARSSLQLIEAGTPLNVLGLIESGVPWQEITCEKLMIYYTTVAAASTDFGELRWKTMHDELRIDPNKTSTVLTFGGENPDFIPLFLNYRFQGMFHTFSERYPNLYVDEKSRREDRRKALKLIKEVTREKVVA
jgi:hypothetical protein